MTLTCIAMESGNLYTSTHGFRELLLPKGCRLNIGGRIDSAKVEEWHEPWNGEGLPPVGTACEFRRFSQDSVEAWVSGTVQYLSEHTAVLSNSAGGEHVHHPRTLEFRPIRTTEQIEEEERSDFARALIKDLKIAPAGEYNFYHGLGETLYRLGYRKQEPKPE